MWKILKEVINKNKTSNMSSQFVINNQNVSDNKVIAEAFNDFYVNVGANLAKAIPNESEIRPESYILHEKQQSIFLKPTDKEEIESVILKLKDSAAGYDDIVPRIIKLSYGIYVEPLVHIFNLSFMQGVFPTELKVAKVIPLYKKDDKANIANYRPVSILPVFSKILEKLLHARLVEFIDKYDILYKYQFGFRSKHSTNMDLLQIVDKIMNHFQDGDFVIGIFLDFSKAFDTVNHEILLRKLSKYGIRGVALKLMSNYLNNRTQFVQYGVNSSMKNISCGVPQGSILGPILFLLYINDIINVSPVLLPILFADDTNIFVNGKCLTQMVSVLNNELVKLVTWLNVNKLSLNVSKTHYIIFSSKRKKVNTDVLTPIVINNLPINRVHSTSFLGVMVDEKLNWQDHIKHIKNKMSKGIGVLCKARKLLKESTLVTLYNTLIYPYLTYCIEVWGGCRSSDINSVFLLQKRAVRIIASAPFRANSCNLFKKYKILPIAQVYVYCILVFMFKFNSSMLPKIFDTMFKYINNSYCTRQTGKLYVPIGKCSSMYNMIRFKGVKLWNSYYDIIDTACNIHTYKKKLKLHLMNSL